MKSSYITLIVLFSSYIVASAADTYYLFHFGTPDITWAAHTLFLGIGLFVWCKQHAHEHDKTNLRFYPLLAAFVAVIGVPVYAYKFYGAKQGSLLLGKALLFVVVSSVAGYITALIVEQFFI
ncbi:hypothetical protein [Alteromonas sp. AMM-1]|uniref:hypothetical protein n=1 Tax=Alteromonas sp. AMM-1 TaxID=3394233 RepID=UPI0039A49C9F